MNTAPDTHFDQHQAPPMFRPTATRPHRPTRSARARRVPAGFVAGVAGVVAALTLVTAAGSSGSHAGYATSSHDRTCTDAVTSANLWIAQGNDMAREGNSASAQRAWGMAESIVGAANSGSGNCRIHTVASSSGASGQVTSGYPAGVAYFIRSGPV